jgi:hypothetical protein
MTAIATAAAGMPSSEFLPYVYGATLGRPSAGRLEKVLEHLKTKTEIEIRQETSVQGADGRAGRVTARSAVPGGTSRNGLPVRRGYVYRGTRQDELTGHLYQSELDAEAEAALFGRHDEAAAVKPAAAKPARSRTRSKAAEPEPVAAPEPAPVAPPEPEPTPVLEVEQPSARDALDLETLRSAEAAAVPETPKPARRCQKCKYRSDSNSHRVMCGDGK